MCAVKQVDPKNIHAKFGCKQFAGLVGEIIIIQSLIWTRINFFKLIKLYNFALCDCLMLLWHWSFAKVTKNSVTITEWSHPVEF